MNRELKRCTSWVLKRQRSQRFNWQYGLDHGERKGIPEKSLHWLWWSLWLYWSQKTCGKFLKRWENQTMYLSSEKPVRRLRSNRIKHETTDLFKIGKRAWQDCVLSLFFSLYADHIMWNAELDESWAGIKTVRKNINNLRYASDTTLMAESEKELRSLLVRVRRRVEKLAWISKLKELQSCIQSHHFMASREKVETVTAAIKLKDKTSLEGKVWQTQTGH